MARPIRWRGRTRSRTCSRSWRSPGTRGPRRSTSTPSGSTRTPSDRVSRMIREVFWDGLTRTIDAEGLAHVAIDAKGEGTDLDRRPRIYVPPRRYGRRSPTSSAVARARPELGLEVRAAAGDDHARIRAWPQRAARHPEPRARRRRRRARARAAFRGAGRTLQRALRVGQLLHRPRAPPRRLCGAGEGDGDAFPLRDRALRPDPQRQPELFPDPLAAAVPHRDGLGRLRDISRARTATHGSPRSSAPPYASTRRSGRARRSSPRRA